MKYNLVVLSALSLGASACGPKMGISEVRMIHAPPREDGCKLEMVQVDVTNVKFNEQWEVLGYVTMFDRGTQDPFSEENKRLVRPRACAMGGTSVSIAANAMNSDALNRERSGISYMVLRPKTWTQGPQSF